MNRTQLGGVISLGLCGVAAGLAAIAMFATSIVLGVVYLALCLIVPQMVLRGFCAKCPNRADCGHVFPGHAALRFARDAGPYAFLDLAGVAVMAVVLFGLPQVWLWRYPVVFGAFWALLIVAGIMIRGAMCPVCQNIYCPGNPKFQKPTTT
jgi:hypothetical protein